MKRLSASVLWLQALLFALATVYVVWRFNQVIRAGGWFVPGFETIELRRLIAGLAPYLVLPVGIIVSFFLHRNGRYAASASFPVVLLAIVAVSGQVYLAGVPDPIKENFGPRPLPYAGFLILPPEQVPTGFQEISHHYTKQEYSISFRKVLDDDQIDLDIVESPITEFSLNQLKLVREFDYRGITGRVYAAHDGKWGRTILNLIWLNPPRQRIAIYLTQRTGDDYSPEDLIRILQSMKPAAGSL